ncbi:MAG TPA: FecR domain-containing protein [Leptospiraceae bacterium]|nr:FecR domain-containing protein [Leptospiraceae bacterium]HNF13525.1 FecR domain-containing protein [Leptospiraceae bacterium]HNM04085.1 FecR domain-containing protein [Leptospiraceae bacterium]
MIFLKSSLEHSSSLKKGTSVFFAFLLLSVFIFNYSCKKPDSPMQQMGSSAPKKDEPKPSALIVFFQGDSKVIHSDKTEERAGVGVAFRNGDRLVTGAKSKVDVQFGLGSIIRIGSESTVEFRDLFQSEGESLGSTVSLETGKIFAKINQKNEKLNFKVIMPTVTAGIRGTEFMAEVAGKKEDVKVVTGKVSVAPRVRFLEKKNLNSPLQKEIESRLSESSILLEEGQEIKLNSSASILQTEELNSEDRDSVLQMMKEFKKDSMPADIKKNEEQELKTMVLVEESIAKEMAEISEQIANPNLSEKDIEKLEARRSSLENQLLKQQDTEKVKFNKIIAEKPKKLKTRKELIQYYERIEKVQLRNGKSETGAIISQENDEVILHTQDGIRRIPKSEVKDVFYENQIKNR